MHRAEELRSATIADILQATDAYRKPDRFAAFLQACACDFHGRPGYAEKPYLQSVRLNKAFDAARIVDAGVIAANLKQKDIDLLDLPSMINRSIREARIAAIANSQ